MARKEAIVTIQGGRDDSRQYHILEMSALKAERWAAKALLAIVESGTDIPDLDPNAGIQALAAVGLKGIMGLRFESLEPLLDEMLECVSYLRKPNDTTTKTKITPENCDLYIEDVSTLVKLRAEVLSVHLGFSLAEKISASLPGQEEKAGATTQATQTPPDTSVQSFQGEWQRSKN